MTHNCPGKTAFAIACLAMSRTYHGGLFGYFWLTLEIFALVLIFLEAIFLLAKKGINNAKSNS